MKREILVIGFLAFSATAFAQGPKHIETDTLKVQDIEDILNLKTVLAKPELSSVYEKTMLDYNLMRETLKSKMKI